MKLKLVVLIPLIVIGCSVQRSKPSKIDARQCEIIRIVEYQSVFLFESITDKGSSLKIVSRKINESFNKLEGNRRPIQIGQKYSFQLSLPERLTVGQMEQFGYHFIVESDTVWSGHKCLNHHYIPLTHKG